VTLLELLIALWVMAAAAMILASSLGMMGRALARVGGEVADVDRISARLTLRRWLEEMPQGARLIGDSGSVTFFTLIDTPPLTAAELVAVRVSGAGGAVRAEAGVIGVDLAPQGQVTGIRYFGAPGPGDRADWRADWPGTATALPDLIRLDYVEGDRVMPPLTVIPARKARQSEMSLSSPVPPG
jgi:hypothetical protein